jgi:hypothetical protein
MQPRDTSRDMQPRDTSRDMQPRDTSRDDDDINSLKKICLTNQDNTDRVCLNYDDLKMLYELKNAGIQGPKGDKGPIGPMGPVNVHPNYEYKIFKKSMIEGENVLKLSYVSPIDCSNVCDKAEWCKSFDYNQEDNKCNLSSANRDTSNVITNDNYTYYEKFQKKN